MPSHFFSNKCRLLGYNTCIATPNPELEFLKSLWGLGTEEEWGYRTGPPGYIGWRSSFLLIDSMESIPELHKRLKIQALKTLFAFFDTPKNTMNCFIGRPTLLGPESSPLENVSGSASVLSPLRAGASVLRYSHRERYCSVPVGLIFYRERAL